MAGQALPTPWNLYNLDGSPYFQDTLEAGEHSPRPLRLFVGRESELRELRDRMYGAGQNGSRQAIAGNPGVGKTTLVQELKALLLADGYLTTDSLVPILPDDTTASVFGRVLGVLYDTMLANRPHTITHPAMQDAQTLVRATRLATGGGGLSFSGIGATLNRGVAVLQPADFMIDGPRVMRDLMRLVHGSDARGVIIHVNNLEALSEADAENAGELLRGLRDPMLMHSGLHFMVVGTVEAVNTVVNAHAQVRNIFTTLHVEPLKLAEVHDLLFARYNFLKRETSREVTPPVEARAVELLYELYRGDLRGLLKALEEGVTPLLGLVSDGAAMPRPIRADELFPVLQQRYAAELARLPEQTRVDQLRAWGESGARSEMTQRGLAELWNVSQGAVSAALKYLIQQGYVAAQPRRGREATRYVLSGLGRLIFGEVESSPATREARSRRRKRK